MEHRHLGRSGLLVSEVTYGNRLTHGELVAREAAELLGEALRGVRRESVEIATKVCLPLMRRIDETLGDLVERDATNTAQMMAVKADWAAPAPTGQPRRGAA